MQRAVFHICGNYTEWRQYWSWVLKDKKEPGILKRGEPVSAFQTFHNTCLWSECMNYGTTFSVSHLYLTLHSMFFVCLFLFERWVYWVNPILKKPRIKNKKPQHNIIYSPHLYLHPHPHSLFCVRCLVWRKGPCPVELTHLFVDSFM